MSRVGDNTDVTVQLPDEVLCHIFSFLSLSQKLRSESVNHKFQRCIHEELKANPQPLALDLLFNKLNGYKFRISTNTTADVLDAVQTLAKKTKFSSILYKYGATEMLDRLLSLLISQNQSLTKVTSFRCDSGCSQTVMEDFLDQCDKLSSIRFDCDIRPLNQSANPDVFGLYSTFPMDLRQLFKNRALTELVLRPFDYHQKGLTDMLGGIHPNILRKLDLCLNQEQRELNVVEMVNALGPNGSALEEMQLKFSNSLPLHVQWDELFESLSHLPALRKCDIEFIFVEPENQFVAAMTLLLALSGINITVTTHKRSFFEDVPGCQAVNMIQQVQNLHPGLIIDFDCSSSLVLSLGDARMVVKYFLCLCKHCGAADCVQCQSFYPSLLSLLRSKARRAWRYSVKAKHFPNWHLDWCRFNRIVDDLIEADVAWRALSVVDNRHDDTVTINFADKRDNVFLSATISYGRCLSNGCEICER